MEALMSFTDALWTGGSSHDIFMNWWHTSCSDCHAHFVLHDDDNSAFIVSFYP